MLKYKYTLTETVEAEAYFAYLCNVNKVLSITFQKKEKCTYAHTIFINCIATFYIYFIFYITYIF